MAGRRKRSDLSPPKKKNALLQMLMRDDDEAVAPPEQFNVVQEYHKLRQELLSRVQELSPAPPRKKSIRRSKEPTPPAPVSKRKKETKKISRPFTEMMQRRIEYRKKLLEYLEGGGDVNEDAKTKSDRRERRYRRYIQHGIGTEHIAPLQQSSINHILALIPSRLKKNFKEFLQSLLSEVQQEFIVGVKIAVVEYVLHDAVPSKLDTSGLNSVQRTEQAVAARARKQKTHKTQIYIKRNLHTINKCVAQILDLWHKSFSTLRLVNIHQLTELEHALELPSFKNLIALQIHTAVQNLRHNWFPALETIFLQGAKRKLIPVNTSQKQLKSLFECVATIMTTQLQQLSVMSIQDFTDFICDTESGNNKGFILEVAYRNKLIVFDPSFSAYRQELLHVLDMMRDAVKCVPRLETVLTERLGLQPLPEDNLFLKPVVPETLLHDAQSRLIATLEEQRILPELRIQDFDPYISLINGEWQEEVEKFLCSKQQSYEEQVARVTQLHQLAHSIPCEAWLVVAAGLFEVHRGPLVVALVQAAIALRDLLLNHMRSDHLALSTKLSEEYESIATRALTAPANTAELMELRAYVNMVEETMVVQLEDRLRQLCQSMLFLVDHMTVSPSEVKQNAAPFQWYGKMPEVFAEHQDIVQKKTAEYQQALKVRTQNFVEALALQEKQVAELQNLGDITELPRYLQRARTLQTRLQAALTDIEQFNNEEVAFGWETSQYPLRQQIAEQLGPYMELYETSSGFLSKHDLWMSSQVGAFHPAEIETEVEGFWQTVSVLEKTFTDIPTVKLLILKVRQRIEEFKDNLPVVQTLGNPDMKERHWEKVSEIVGFPLKADASLTLARIIDFGLGDYNPKFQVISDSATKENNLEKALNLMVEEWAEMGFSVVPYRESGTHFLSSIDDIQLLLDDHIVKTQTMRNSPYIKPFEKDIAEWESNLMLLQEILDSWIKVQGSWMYLEPIFSSPDIQAQMPEEGRRFGAVDKMWRDIMKVVLMDLHVLVVARIDKMLERLHKSSDLLDAIQRGLNDYLDKKRLFFPRFFFLSNDELLEILCETKDPTRVQPNLKKCFRGVAQLSFTEDMAVSAIRSAQGEEVELCDQIDTAAARGQVEQWLQQLEVAIKKCVHKMIKDAVGTVTNDCRNEWLLAQPAQAVLCVSQVQWTKEVEASITAGNLPTLLTQIEAQISEEAELLNGELTLNNRTMMGSLLTQDVSSKQIISRMIAEQVKDVNDFEWISQLRTYWQEEQVTVQMMNTSLQYGYEYLGDSTRLVMTPQTIKCFQTIFAALHLNFGACLEGPTSSGKTETVKDLANIVAKQYVIINCSTGLDTISFTKLFKGVASAGAWICLDEFDRLHTETISSVSHLILAIQRAVRSKSDSITLDSSTLSFDRSCIVLATLSPRASFIGKLPPSLRAIMRPAAMIAPDFKLISEVILFSNGFKNAKLLASKIATTFALCSRQLSQQSHYDHGLRAIKAVLLSAAEEKLKSPELPEDYIIQKAIYQINLSKYTLQDVPLFEKMMKSIFGNSEELDHKYELLDKIKSICEAKDLQTPTAFLEQIEQLYKLLQVRQGVIILGPTYSGKTTAYKVLSSALAEIEKNNNGKVQTIIINPKALTLNQLYGKFDPVTHEWSDGVLAICYRQLATSNSSNRKWLIFDGPIDSTWVENLNTVLDDNKRLFLMSGENCHLSKTMNLIFETAELQNASPSTVSRCGIMYMDSSTLGWHPLLQSWINALPEILKEQSELITQLFERFFPPLFSMRKRKFLSSLYPLIESNLVKTAMNIFDCFVEEFTDEKGMEEVSSLDLRAQLEGVFFYSCIWSMGGCLDAESRIKFDKIFRALLQKEFPEDVINEFGLVEIIEPPAKPYIFPIPDRLTVFDYRYFKEGKGKWRPWEDELKNAPAIPREIPVNQILVPTIETVRCLFLLQQLVSNGKPVMFVGPSGVGKTSYISDFLTNKVDKNTYKPLFILYTAHTSASDVQDLVMNNLDKRRKGVYGPPLGKRCLVFVDDVNLPESPCGSQPPVELLRQLLDHESWFDTTIGAPLRLMDLQLLCAMGPSPEGLDRTSHRFLRHFCTLSINEFEDTILVSIFSRLMLWHLDTRGFSKEFDPSIDELVAATLKIYRETKKVLLPTPSKWQYIFNLRDFSRVIQGVLLSVPEAIEDLAAMKRLWVHEVLRVFGDRIVDQQDRNWLLGVLNETCDSKLGNDMNRMFKHLLSEENNVSSVGDFELRQVLFCDFGNPKADSRNYGEISELDNLRLTVERCHDEYNNMSRKPTELVLFRYAVEHLSRICRLLKQPRSHALLVGPIGSGRQAIARIAAHISYYELFQPEVTKAYTKTQWREEIKDLLIKTGTSDQNMVLLFTDSQAKYESFLEDICHLLTLGEIPNLLSVEEKNEIIEKMGQIDKQRDKTIQTDGSNVALFNFFIQRLRDQLHLVLCMNPESEHFHDRLRKFPALINCCTINWFLPWPADALEDVAVHMLADSNLEADELKACISLCQQFHADAQELAITAKNTLDIHSLVTPASYTQLLDTFRRMLSQKRDAVKGAQERYETAVEKILAAEKQVPEMQLEMKNLQPQLKEAAEKVEQLALSVDTEARDVAEAEQVVLGEEADFTAKTNSVKELQVESEAGLAEALPAYQEACTALEMLPVADIAALRGTKSPPKNLKLLMEAICAIKDIKPDKVANPAAAGRTMDDYWGPGKKLLGDAKVVEALLQIDKENIPAKASKQIAERVLPDDSFDPDKLKSVSVVAEGLCRWVIALYNYDVAAKIAAPKKQALTEATEELQIATTALEEKRAALQESQSTLSDLRAELAQAQAFREELLARLELCQKKLKRSEELLGALLSETDNWTKKATVLAESYHTITGDVIVGAGVVAYLGPYPALLRQKQVAHWVEACAKHNITCSVPANEWSIAKVLGNVIELRDWAIAGLPGSDAFCMDSAIVTRNTGRWPLLIDPEGQANKWIRSIEAANQLLVVRFSDSDYLRTLESGVQSGKPVLLENIGEQLDSLLEPLLLKQFFKQSTTSFGIKLGESVIEYNPNFRFYITTRIRKPCYSSEIASKVTMINFCITQTGLQEQLLSMTVARERPDLESEKTQLLSQGAENNRQLQDLENKILEEIWSSQGNILEDDSAVHVVCTAKTLINEVTEKQSNTEQTEISIDKSRLGYEPVAEHSSAIYFSITQLSALDPMYQFSLAWFTDLFTSLIDSTERVEDLSRRLQDLSEQFTLTLYKNVSLCLFEKDKLLYLVLLCLALNKLELEPLQWKFLLNTKTSFKNGESSVYSDWLPDEAWNQVCHLNKLPNYQGIKEHLESNENAWKDYFESKEPHLMNNPWNSELQGIQSLLILQCFRPDMLIPALYKFVKDTLGNEFITHPPFHLATSYAASSCKTPLVFLHSADADPTASLLKFADDMRVAQKMQIISLGEDQGPTAHRVIEEAMKIGSWVLLQNCHLEPTWMTALEKICDGLGAESTHPEFRLWLSSLSSKNFSAAIIQMGITMAYDPPKNLKENILRSYQSDPIADSEFFESCTKLSIPFRKLVFGISFFHALVLERSGLETLGWNQPYKFSKADLRASLHQLQAFLHEAKDNVPFEAIHYLISECYYGGAISDPWDQRCMGKLLDLCCGDKIMNANFTFDEQGIYTIPNSAQYEDHLAILQTYPMKAQPNIYGINPNVALIRDKLETANLLKRIAKSQEDVEEQKAIIEQKTIEKDLFEAAEEILRQLPLPFVIHEAKEKLRDIKEEPFNVFLLQEMHRYNTLLKCIISSLQDVINAAKGHTRMSPRQEKIAKQILNGKTPKYWQQKSYPSLKPLSGFIIDLFARLKYLQEWYENGSPKIFWLSGFFFPNGFLTTLQQHYILKHEKEPMEEITFECEVLRDTDCTPDDGVLIQGLHIHGACWDHDKWMLGEISARNLYNPLPVVWLKPCLPTEVQPGHYLCPVYQTSERGGKINSAGLSSNFIFALPLPTEQNADHWILRGVALLCQLPN